MPASAATRPRSVAVIGGGPAGLRAAEVAAGGGAAVTLYDAKRSVGRKFLVAGKSGLNLTHAAGRADFLSRYAGEDFPATAWEQWFDDFDAEAMRSWAAGLGVETFAASSGKVFPREKKAAPLLRRWVERLRRCGVRFAVHHRWTGLCLASAADHPESESHDPSPRIDLFFQTPADDGAVMKVVQRHDAVVLALGGGSWPDTGSDGSWVRLLEDLGVKVRPLVAANCGWECAWTPETRARVEGRPLHNLRMWAGGTEELGELMSTRYGLEGTLIYQLGRALRAMPEPAVHIDFKPSFTIEHLLRKMEPVRRDFVREAGQRWKLPDAAAAIIEQFHGPITSVGQLARAVKDCRVPLLRPRPVAEAISSAGGVAWSELDDQLMLRKLPGVYCAGEMIDWEAPTGGFLLQGCFLTGTRAGRAAAG